MEKVLKLYKSIDGEKVAFPSSSSQIMTSDFTYSAQRMGGAPTISCTIMWNVCLDNMWDGVYCEFNGEKYHIAKTPSSSKDNTDSRYKHNVQFVSDRVKLDSVLFYNKVEENKNPLNTSTEFSFWGDIKSFAERLNRSLEASNLEYRVDADGVTSEEKLFKAENMFISSALQEINKTYGLMYYFVGTTIHIGEQQSLVNGLDLQYGFDKQLLSISKNNKNNKIVTRITGHGSDENIPYYYPNPTEKGTIEVVGEGQYMNGNVSIVNYHKFASSMNYGETVYLHQTYKNAVAFDVYSSYIRANDYHGLIENKILPNSAKRISGNPGETRMSYIVDVRFVFNDSGRSNITFMVPRWQYVGVFKIDNLVVDNLKIFRVVNSNNGLVEEYQATPDYSDDYWTTFSVSLGDIYATDESYAYDSLEIYFDIVHQHSLGSGFWEDYENFAIPFVWEQEMKEAYVWKGQKKESANISDFGLKLLNAEHFENNKHLYLSNGFKLLQTEYIQPSKYLMPSVYRKDKGGNRFYPAKNQTYTDANGNFVEFVNEYDETKPSEHVENFEDIKPTIKGVKNSAGHAIDCFSAFAYDRTDNDETDENGNYIHPFFFGKLNALGFNLFDHAIDSGEMTISMTTGHCASCNFVIGVDDKQQKNLVQVDENGNLSFDENGNVICGRKVFVDGAWVGQSATPQDIQNDTTNNSVWVALKKDTNTFGYIYPNKNVKPSTSDTFVILHIDLPQLYITKAEDRLDAALIEFMRKNNAEEFDYSIKFSRIFWEENPTTLASFNENSRVNVRYNNVRRQMYVSSFTYKCSSNEALPEISVSLSNELNIGTNTIQSVVNELKDFEGTVSILEQQSRAKAAPAIRKDIDDDAYGAVTFHQKPTFKEGIQSDKAIKVGVGASEGFADGTGTYIDERKIQVRDLEVRGSLKVTDLVASQIHSLDGEYIFTDTMKIDRVLPTGAYIGDDDTVTLTCRLYFEKEYKNDFLKFYVGDLLLSVVANIDDSESSVKVDDAGNAMREISMDSFMRVTHTSDSMSDVLWADVEILDGTSMPSDGAYVARRGNVGVDENGLKRATSWSISVNDGRIVYYINQTNETREGNLKDNNYGLAIGRLPDITPVRNVGAVGEIGIYAKYLLAQHITQVRWAGNTQYVTIDRGEWVQAEADNQVITGVPYYFYKEEPKTEGANTVTYITRTKVEHKQCTWICQQNVVGYTEDGDFELGDYNTQEPSIGSGWAILSGGGIVTETIIMYTTTATNKAQPTDYDTDGMAIGSDEVVWYDTQEECEYNALFPYMWKKTTTKTMSNPLGDTIIELIGVYGETGLNAHIEVEEGNNIIVPCDSSLNAKEKCSFSRKAVLYLDENPLTVDEFEDITAEQVPIGYSFRDGVFTFEIEKGADIGTERKLSFRFHATYTSNGEEIEYTRIVTFSFTPNTSEQAYSINVSPSTLYIPVKEGVISADGSSSATVRVLSGSTMTDVKIADLEIKYFGSTTGYVDSSTIDGDYGISILFDKDTALTNESDYAMLEITMENGMKTSIPVLQNISGSNAVGEDAYSSSLTPSAVAIQTTADGLILGEPYLTFTAYMYRGSRDALIGTTVSTVYNHSAIKSIEPNNNNIFVTLKSGVKMDDVIQIPCTISNADAGVSQTQYITLSPVAVGTEGNMGYTGAVQRVFYDKLVNGQTYYSNSDTDEAIGVRFQDAILIECDTYESGYIAFFCISTFTMEGDLTFEGLSASDIKTQMTQSFDGKQRFEEVAINASSAFFTQLIARNANVRMLSGAEIVMLGKDNKVVAGVSNAGVRYSEEDGEQIGYHFWSGNADPNKASFSVNEEGHLVATGADIQGSIKVSSMFYGEPIQHDGQLTPNSDTSCIITTVGDYILPQPNLFVGLSYKFFLPATRGMASTTITGSFKETSVDFQPTNKIEFYYGAIELISIGESWLVVRYGDALMEYI